MEILTICRTWMQDIRNSPTYSNRTQMLGYCYNWCTDPSKLRTDLEHKICNAFGKWCKAKLSNRRGNWYFNDDEKAVVHYVTREPFTYKGEF